MKKIYHLILTIIILFSLGSTVQASTNTQTRTREDLKVSSDIYVTEYNIDDILQTPKVDETEKIYDFAEKFTVEEEQVLFQKITEFIQKTQMDMAIVTITENNKNWAMSYADDFYDYNNFGLDAQHTGILFLIDFDTREVYISTTGKAIETYSDTAIELMLDDICVQSPLVDSYGCAERFVKTAEKYYKQYENRARNMVLLITAIVATIATAGGVMTQVKKHKTVKVKRTGKDYLENQSVRITMSDDKLIDSHVSRIRIERSTSSGGGSSSHSGSSGRSHGGGGRGF